MSSLNFGGTAAHTSALRPWSAGSLVVLCLLLAAHAGLIAWVVAGLFPESRYNPVDETGLRQVAVPCLATLVALAYAGRRRPALAVSLAVVAVALALLLPGPVLTTGWILFDGWLLGELILRVAAGGESAAPDPVVCTLAGIALMIGLFAATATLRVHDPGVYGVMLLLPLAGALPRWRSIAARAARSQEDPQPWSVAERAWLGVLGTVVVLHVFVVAKPEVGYDAQAMHLQFARMLAAQHAWTFDVERFGWAVMPLGADWMLAVPHILAGEASARLLNLGFGVLAGALLYRLVRGAAPRLPGLITVSLFASAPLAFLVTGSLFSETLWCAFLLATLVTSLSWLRSRAPADLAALLLTAAGALQCKAISLLWLAPLAVGLVLLSRGAVLRIGPARLRVIAVVAVVIGAWPYVNAAWRTGNPVFPFFNAVFHSPLLERGTSFTNHLYHAALLPWTPYELVTDSARFLEGVPGAPGFHWLILLPLTALALARNRITRVQWACIALGLVFFVAVFVQQSYLRYLLPAMLVAAAASGWALAGLPDGRATRIAVGIAGCLLIALNLRFMYTASWYHVTLCRHCAFDAKARTDYVARYAPLRIAADWIAANLPDARVGFFSLNDANPAGFVGYSRGGNWHDLAVYPSLRAARTADDVLAIAQRWRLTHVLVREAGGPEEWAIAAFRDRDTKTVWQFANYRIAVLAPAATPAAPPLSAQR